MRLQWYCFVFFCCSFLAAAAQPHLQASFSVQPANSIKLGEELAFTFKIKNTGSATTQLSHTSIYISGNTSITNATLLTDISTQSLGANEQTPDIRFVYPLPYNLSMGNYYVVLKTDARQELTGSTNSTVYPSSSFSISDSGRQQNLPYPIILIHGLFSDRTTWAPLINDFKNNYGWSYGGNMNFCLNQDGNLATASLATDYKDWTDTGSLNKADVYTINFNVGVNGQDVSLTNPDVKSNQCAIKKQGLAVKDAIAHVLQITGRKKVILLCHSMGGLAAREYLQNNSNWQQDGSTHVAKLVTLGTPHGGSNSTLYGFGPIDERSEAVRDLRTKYAFSGDSGVYLFGGRETYAVMNNSFLYNYYNVDVNCNGSDADGTLITGLNDKSLTADPLYSCVVGIQPALGDDGIVTAVSANLNNFYPGAADSFVVNANHLALLTQTAIIMKGLDEPDNSTHAYEMENDKLYFANLTRQSSTAVNSADVDDYSFVVNSDQWINVKIYNIPITAASVSIYNSSNQIVYSANTNGKAYVDCNLQLTAGTYYVELAATAAESDYQYPYAIRVSATQQGSCAGGDILYNAGITGNNYQWQVDNGNGYVNLTDDSLHAGTSTSQLILKSPPTSWSGYHFRCMLNGNIFSAEQTLKFTLRWTGGISTAWENPANWNCGNLPDTYTDVVIPAGVKYFPQVNNNAFCKSLSVAPTAVVLVKNGVQLKINGR